MESRGDASGIDSNWRKWKYHDSMVFRGVVAFIFVEGAFLFAAITLAFKFKDEWVPLWSYTILIVLVLWVVALLTTRVQRLVRGQILRDIDARTKWGAAVVKQLTDCGPDVAREYALVQGASADVTHAKRNTATATTGETTSDSERDESFAATLDFCMGANIFLAFCITAYIGFLALRIPGLLS